MPAYKAPDFHDRAAAARSARQAALDRLREQPARDPALVAERQAMQAARKAAVAERSAARKSATDEARTARRVAAQEAASSPAPRSEAELRAARDARYAARKARRA